LEQGSFKINLSIWTCFWRGRWLWRMFEGPYPLSSLSLLFSCNLISFGLHHL